MSRQDIDFKIGADLKQFRSGMQSIDHSLKQLSGGFSALGGVIGASFAVDAIRQFASEAVDLAMTTQGVRAAFEGLNDPKALDNLREATSGTVSDLKLMQLAVDAKNFHIPMDVLAKGLKFAQRRAIDTGKSIDYLVDSFVTGLGRESVKILDNLGISAIELNEKTQELGSMTAAVGAIMDKSFEEGGERIVTTTMKVQQQRAEIDNLKADIGEKLLPAYNAVLSVASEIVSVFADPLPSGFEVEGKTEEQLRNQLAVVEKRITLNERDIKNYPKNLTYQKNVTRLEDLRTATLTALNAKLEEKKELEMIESGERARLDAEEEKRRKAKALAEAIAAYNLKLEEAIPNLKKANFEIQKMFAPGALDSDLLAKQLGFDDVDLELEEIPEVIEQVEEFENTVFKSFEQINAERQQLQQGFAMMGEVLRASFDAAFAPLEEGETRIGNFTDVFVNELKRMVAQLLATAAAAAVLAAIMSVAFGGAGVAGGKIFGDGFKGGFGALFGNTFQGMGGFGFNGSLGGANGQDSLITRIVGEDLLVMLERAGRTRGRTTGIIGG